MNKYNYFKNLLDEIDKDYHVIPNNLEDQEIANQYEKMLNYKLKELVFKTENNV